MGEKKQTDNQTKKEKKKQINKETSIKIELELSE